MSLLCHLYTSLHRKLFLEIWCFLTEKEKRQTRMFISDHKKFIVPDVEYAAMYSWRNGRNFRKNSWNVPFPPMWVGKNNSSKYLLKVPHLLCTFHKEICLLEGIAAICFVIVGGKQHCSEGTFWFQWISGHQDFKKFGLFLEARISYFHTDSSSISPK